MNNNLQNIISLKVLLIALALLSAISANAQSTKSSQKLDRARRVSNTSSVRAEATYITPLRCEPREIPNFIWGITATKVTNISDITYALADLRTAFPTLKPDELPPIIVRVVFDPSKSEEEFTDSVRSYQNAISSISKYSYVMGTIADSYDWYPYTSKASDASTSGHNNYRWRAEKLIRAMGDCVQVWEVGNEVNGEWTGWKKGHVPRSTGKLLDMRDKIGHQITDAFKVVQAYNSEVAPAGRKRTAITLLYNSDGPESDRRTCYDKPEYEMRSWATKYIDKEVRDNVDYVLISYYENKGDCPGLKQDATTFIANFKALTAEGMFPKAKVGFGEVGYKETCPKDHDEKRADSKECILGKPNCPSDRICIGQEQYIIKYYQTLNDDIMAGLTSTQARKPDGTPLEFIGGYFYWFFVQDMTGKNKSGESTSHERNRNALKKAMSGSAVK